MNKNLQKAMKYLAGIGALNWGSSEFLNLNLLSYVPDGFLSTVVVAFIAISGGFVVYWAWNKKI